jgi:uncharacterized protein (TIGR02996 family)
MVRTTNTFIKAISSRFTAGANMSSSTGEILERALVADPDDVAAHAAYADWLMQKGDPRGEFIQVQLSLADPALPADENARCRQRESDLLSQHAKTWLGDLGRFLVGAWSGADKPYHFHFALGWLDHVRILPVPEAIIDVLARAPEARLLRRLEIVYDMRYHPFDFGEFTAGPKRALRINETGGEIYEETRILPQLMASPYLANLRVFKLGFSDTGHRIGHSTMVVPFGYCNVTDMLQLLERCPRLDELYLNCDMAGIERIFALPTLNVRALQYYYGTNYGDGRLGVYPLSALAQNPAAKCLTTLRLHPGRDTTIELPEFDAILRSPHLPNLTHLQVHMTTFGDAGCRSIVDSGILRRLKVLDIGYGDMSDDGARVLAASPELKNLDQLVVSRNALTPQGIAALQATGTRVVAEDQHDQGEDGLVFLYDVDFE